MPHEGDLPTRLDDQLLDAAQAIARLGVWVVEFGKDNHTSNHTWTDQVYALLELDTKAAASVETFLSRVHPRDRDFVELFLDKHASPTEQWEINYRLQMPDGRLKHVAEASRTLSEEDGSLRRLITLSEITEFTLLEEQLADHMRQQEAVAELGMLAAGDDSRSDKLRAVLDKTTGVLGAELGVILAYDADADAFEANAVHGWELGPEELAAVLAEQARYTTETVAPVWTIDLDDETRFEPAAVLTQIGVRSSVSLPIRSPAGVFGVLAFHARSEARLSNDLSHFLQAVANIVATITEEDLARRRLQLAAEIFNSHEPMFIADADGTILEVNQAFLDLYEMDLVGSSADELNADLEVRAPSFDQLAAEPSWSGEVHHRTATGRVPVLITISRMLGERGDVANFVGHVTELTQLRKKEHEVQRALRLDAIGQMSSGLAHDFNNLLGVIDGNLKLIKEFADVDDGIASMFDDAFSAIRDGSDLTRRLLSFSHALPENALVVSVRSIIDNMEAFLARVMGADIELASVHHEGDAHVKVDVGALESAMLNLAINARDAMPEGGELTIAADVQSLELENAEGYRVPRPGDYAIIGMSDTGTGIDEATLPFVFEPFFTTKSHGKGNGLGLSMVQSFLAASGGAGHISSQVGTGTTVSLLLPLTNEEPEEHAADIRGTIERSQGNETILIVEDEPRLRRIVVRQLQSLNYEVLESENADMAKQVIESGNRISVVFTDIMMPGTMDGKELAEWVRAKHPEMGILLTSGHSKVDSLDGYHDAAGFPLLRKPFDKKDLANALRRVLDG